MIHGFAWILLLYSFLPIILGMKFLRGKRMSLAFIAVMGFHHIIAILNSFVSPVRGAGKDGERFHHIAEVIAQKQDFYFSIGADVYNNFLAISYFVFGSSQFLGAELSVMAFGLSFLLLVKLMDILEISRYRVSVLLLFGLLPTAVIHTSVTLRESWEILFFMSTVYFGLRYQFDRKWKYIFLAIAAVAAFGSLHHGMLAFSVFLLPCVLLWPIGHRSMARAFLTRPRAIFALLGCFGALAVALALSTQAFNVELASSLMQGEVLEYSSGFREGTAPSRATYDAPLELSSVSGFLLSFAIIILHYVLEPFPWKIMNIVDLYAFFEVLLRVLLFMFSWWAITQEHGAKKQIMTMLLVLYVVLSIIWALGTTNYGTAIRHHLVGYWVILLLGAPQMFRAISVLHFVVFPPLARVQKWYRNSLPNP